MRERQAHCGHPRSAIVSEDEGTAYCAICAHEARDLAQPVDEEEAFVSFNMVEVQVAAMLSDTGPYSQKWVMLEDAESAREDLVTAERAWQEERTQLRNSVQRLNRRAQMAESTNTKLRNLIISFLEAHRRWGNRACKCQTCATARQVLGNEEANA